MSTASGTRRAGVIGDPVGHSISPGMYQPALDALGIPVVFERWHVTAPDLPAFVAGLRAPDFLGASVTVPHKLAVRALVDEIAESAQDVGAVNTLVPRDGKLIGENTDAYGFRESLREVLPDAGSRTAMILGAGGAARAVAVAMRDFGCTEIIVANRDLSRAERLRDELPSAPVRAMSNEGQAFAEALARSGVVINATSLGWKPDESPLTRAQVAALADGTMVADLTYRETDLLREAAERDLPTLDGLGMLVHQGVIAFTMWTGQAPPIDVLRKAALAAQAARH